ncbi:BamA/OMP85 family outer membrane protein [Desulfurobacterium sp.]
MNRSFWLLLFAVFFVCLPASAKVVVVSRVPFPAYLKAEIENEASVVCRIDNCSLTIPKVLDAMGYEAGWEGGRIIVKKNLIIKSVIFKNLPFQLRKSVKTIKGFLIGQKFSRSFVENAKLLLRFKLEDFGFKDARVDVISKLTPEGYVLIFEVKHGLPHQIKKITVICADKEIKQYVYSQLRNVLLGKRLKRTYLFEQLKQIENHFISRGYYNFEITTQTRVYDTGKSVKSVELVVKVVPGKLYKIKILGNRHVSTDKILSVITFKRDRAFDEFEVEQSKDNIVELYKNSGFPFAKVSVEIVEHSQRNVSVFFKVTEGAFVRINTVSFKYSGSFDDKNLMEEIKDVALALKGRPFSAKKIEDIRDNIEYVLKTSGYLNATVQYKFRGSAVLFLINPGVQFLVAGIRGVPFRIDRKFPFPYSPTFETKIESDVADYYRNEGYVDAKVIVNKKIVRKGGKALVFLDLKVIKGRRYRVGFFLLTGLDRTKISSLTPVAVVKPGNFYNRKRIIEQYSILSGTRIFSMIDLKEIKSDRTVNPVFVLKESPVLSVKGFVGYSTDAGATVRGTVKSSSPFGRAFSVFLSGEYRETEGSNVLFKIGRSGFLSPRNRAYLSLIRKTEIFESFDVERYITRFEISRKQGKSLKQNYGVEISKEIVNDAVSGDTRFYKKTLFIVTDYDKRDSFSIPTRGYRFYLKLSYTGGFLGGDADYFLSELKLLRLKRIRKNFVVALRAGTGYIKPFGAGVPIQDRFYLGGAESIRGYKYGTISPLDSSGNYVGGDFYSLASLELRYTFFKEFQLALFCDAGDVFPEASDFTFNGWYSSVGAGFRYLTPVGPLRLDYGYKLKPIEGQGRGRFHLSFGFPF